MTTAEIEARLDKAILQLTKARAKAQALAVGNNEWSHVNKVCIAVDGFHLWASGFLDQPFAQRKVEGK